MGQHHGGGQPHIAGTDHRGAHGPRLGGGPVHRDPPGRAAVAVAWVGAGAGAGSGGGVDQSTPTASTRRSRASCQSGIAASRQTQGGVVEHRVGGRGAVRGGSRSAVAIGSTRRVVAGGLKDGSCEPEPGRRSGVGDVERPREAIGGQHGQDPRQVGGEGRDTPVGRRRSAAVRSRRQAQHGAHHVGTVRAAHPRGAHHRGPQGRARARRRACYARTPTAGWGGPTPRRHGRRCRRRRSRSTRTRRGRPTGGPPRRCGGCRGR